MRERIFLIKFGNGPARMRRMLEPVTGSRLYIVLTWFLLFSLANS